MAQRAEPGLVGHPKQEVALLQGAHGAALTLGGAAFAPAHQGAAPGIGRRVGEGAERRVSRCGVEGARSKWQ